MWELQTDLRREGATLRCVVKEMDEDRLFENRTFFTQASIALNKRMEQKKEKFRSAMHQPSEMAVQKKEAERAAFARYGLKISNSEPNLKTLTKLFNAAQER